MGEPTAASSSRSTKDTRGRQAVRRAECAKCLVLVMGEVRVRGDFK